MFGLVQRMSTVFPLTFDIDNLERYEKPLELVKHVVEVTHETIARPSKDLFQHRDAKRFHIIYGDVFVDKTRAENIYKEVLLRLYERHPGVEWKEVLNESLTGANGLS